MTATKIVAVMGATGAQGGSVVHSLIKDKTFAVRAITRNPNSDAAKSLAALGAEVVKADANNKQELLAAFKGVYAVFAVTNFWDREIVGGDQSLEEKQGKIIADAAEECNVKHFIYSSLPNVHDISGGKYKHVVHFDGKNRVEQYIRKHKKLNATFVMAGFYSTNLIHFMPPYKDQNGELVFSYALRPDTPVPMTNIPKDFGPVVLAVLKEGPEATKDKSIFVASEYVTPTQVAEIFTKVTGRKATYKPMDRETHKKNMAQAMGETAAEEFIEMLEYFNDYGYYKNVPLDETRKYNPNLTKFEDWLKESKWTGPE